MDNAARIIAGITGANIIRYFAIAGLAFILFYKLFPKQLQHLKIQARNARIKDFTREIGHSMQSAVVFGLAAFIILRSPLRNYTLIYNNITDFPLWYIPISLILALVIQDTYFYWMHRLLHNQQLYKYTHAVHHRSVNPSPFTAYSFHVLEAVAEALALVPIVLLLPIHKITIILFTLIGFIINVYEHLGYEIAPRWLRYTPLFEVLTTSVYHNLHHSKFRGNYGLYFRLWDRLLKTENPDYVREYDRIQAQRFAKQASAKH
ncbi:sterol desaturase family protein [Flavobacterium sp. RHBU_3]|uniref:sterol desaturase family protein n=1 Tax=Flavobacterium sp. RHBU_3 TaxID=3391184 RepID=UPI003984E48F